LVAGLVVFADPVAVTTHAPVPWPLTPPPVVVVVVESPVVCATALAALNAMPVPTAVAATAAQILLHPMRRIRPPRLHLVAAR